MGGGGSCLGLDRLPPWWVTVLHFCSRLPSQPWQDLKKFPGCCSSSPPQECAGLDMLISPSTVPCPARLLCLSWNRGGQTECLMGLLTHWLRAACSALVWTQTKYSEHSPCPCPQGTHNPRGAGSLALRLCQPRTAQFYRWDSKSDSAPEVLCGTSLTDAPDTLLLCLGKKEMSDQLRIGRTLRNHLRLRKVKIPGSESESKSPCLLLDLLWSPKTALHPR